MNNMYDTFDDLKFTYFYPYSFSDKDYLRNKNLIEFEWYYSDLLQLNILLRVALRVESDAILFYSKGLHPTTVNFIGLKAYNFYDMDSWTCKENGWVLDSSFTTTEEADTDIIIPYDSCLDKLFIVCFYNYRYELIYTTELLTVEDDCSLIVKINADVSKDIFKKGIYSYSVKLIDLETMQPICTLTDDNNNILVK